MLCLLACCLFVFLCFFVFLWFCVFSFLVLAFFSFCLFVFVFCVVYVFCVLCHVILFCQSQGVRDTSCVGGQGKQALTSRETTHVTDSNLHSSPTHKTPRFYFRAVTSGVYLVCKYYWWKAVHLVWPESSIKCAIVGHR